MTREEALKLHKGFIYSIQFCREGEAQGKNVYELESMSFCGQSLELRVYLKNIYTGELSYLTRGLGNLKKMHRVSELKLEETK